MAFLFVCFEMIAGSIQLLTCLLVDDGRKKMKYFRFAPFYMLIYWMINAVTIVTTFVPSVKTIMGYGTGVWVSPQRQGQGKKYGKKESRDAFFFPIPAIILNTMLKKFAFML